MHGLACLAVLDVFQAGGGGSFGGGGGGGVPSSGGGGGGAGGGDPLSALLYLLIRLAIEAPLIGVPLLVAVAFGAYRLRGRLRRGGGGALGRMFLLARANRTRVSHADRLRATDPDFDEARFLQRVKVAFEKAQAGWCAQDLEPLRPFVSDGVFERFSLQLEEQRRDGWRQRMRETRVLETSVACVEVGGQFDAITVQVRFHSKIDRIELDGGEPLAGSALPRSHFVEYWTFLRRSGTRSVSHGGLIEGRCPVCAADLTMNQSARCAHCGCLARSGQFDWVLIEISQAGVWVPETESEIPGFRRSSASDPGLSVPTLEDHASVAFWRRIAAERDRDAARLASVADEALVSAYPERWRAEPGETPTYLANCAVGAVRTLAFLAEEARSIALVQVVWDGVQTPVGRSPDSRSSAVRRRTESLFVFSRPVGSRTRIEESFQTSHCSNCGAHDKGTEALCAYCEAPLRDESTWILTDVLDGDTPQVARWTSRIWEARRADREPEPLR